MGKIVALGGGSLEEGELAPIFEYIRSLSSAEKPKMLFLPTASFDCRDGSEAFIAAFEALGCVGEALYLTDESLTKEEIREKIVSSDIVYVDGGNLKFLMDTWNKTGATQAFREAYENGTVLSGLSSGAMCWFDCGYDDCGEDNEFMFIDCVGLLPYCNCPHYESDYWQPFKIAVKEQNKYDGIAVDNRVAVSFVDGEISVIKSDTARTAYLLKKDNGYVEENMAE